MKRLLLFYIMLAFVHSFSAAAAEKSSFHRDQAVFEAPLSKAFAEADSESLKNGSFQKLFFLSKDSNQDRSSGFEFKRKATELKFAELPAVYQNNFYLIKQYSGQDFFGLANLYAISLHTYLHLYQLF